MSIWDSADLLERFQRESGIPTSTTYPTSANIYSWLEEGHVDVYQMFVVHAPWALMTAPTLLTSSDSNETYDMPTSQVVMAVEIYDSKGGRLLRPSPYWDPNGDYVFEGNKIRFPRGKTKAFSDGPYIRYAAEPGVLNASNEPTLLPKHARILVVYKACVKWASRGGLRDPKPFRDMFNESCWGDPGLHGDIGILGALKAQNPYKGVEAFAAGLDLVGLQYISTGEGYTAL